MLVFGRRSREKVLLGTFSCINNKDQTQSRTMTSQSPRIYIYKITFEEVPYYYYGVKKEKYFNEGYLGTPITNKWCWDFYTPKKQILEVFPYTDDGWLEAQEVEKRLIKPFFNTDKWCLNENVGGYVSLKISRKNGKKVKELGIGVFSMSTEQLSYAGSKGGKIGGSISGKRNYKLGLGIASLTTEERREIVSRTNSQKWMCLETGYITTSGPLTAYQRAKGIDTSKRKRIL